jgi:ParB-like chromosome segregation protein Spo0J
MATTIHETGRHIALDEIRVPENVRALDPEHVKALAGSIKLQGMLVPVVVRDDGDGFELVSGFHRIAAAHTLGWPKNRVTARVKILELPERAQQLSASDRPSRPG